MSIRRLIIGTRGSQLSIVQTNYIKAKLEKLLPNTQIEIRIVKTTGDRRMIPVPLDTVGKGWFTKELDKALLEGTIDLAVHSLKDIPEILPDGLIIAAVPIREDARDALITKNGIPFLKLKKSAVIGTDSIRRKAQLLQKRTDLLVTSIRGNVNSRIQKLTTGNYDGIVLAVAGLKRLGVEDKITEYLDIVPSPGQGALAVVAKKDNKALVAVLRKLNHKQTFTAVKAERAFSSSFGGGCKIPVGAYAQIRNRVIKLTGFVGSEDGMHAITRTIKGPLERPKTLGTKLADSLLKESKAWFKKPETQGGYIVITRPQKESKNFGTSIKKYGFTPLFLPTIAIQKKKPSPKTMSALSKLNEYDWLVFTSTNGISFFLDVLKLLDIDSTIINKLNIAAVGPITAEKITKCGYNVRFIPTKFTTNALADELPDVKGKKILLPRATIASVTLSRKLKKRGAMVTDLPVYETEYVKQSTNKFENAFLNKQIRFLTFSSPSTVNGFLSLFKKYSSLKQFLTIPVISIGPVTTKKLKKSGFKKIYTASVHTQEGMITKIKENIL